MDTALELKIKMSENRIHSFEEARPYLERSMLFQDLLSAFEPTSLNLLHRLIELSEIPYASEFKEVQHWRDQLADLTFCEEGFSLSGKANDILACYNGMITSVLIKLNYPDQSRIDKGIDWIVRYQNTRRNQSTDWHGKGILKYGGCMKATPCYIGVVKSMNALSDYKTKNQLLPPAVDEKLADGLEYILAHRVFKRKSTDAPITKDITRLTYPFTYKTNVVEILRLLKVNNAIDDPRVDEAKAFLEKKKKGDHWKANSFYKPKFWIDFDSSKEKSEWIDFEIKNTLY